MWKSLQNTEHLREAISSSRQRPVVIFKHSTRCSISSMAWDRLKRNWSAEDDQIADAYFLDLIQFREISNAVAQQLGIEHASPQVLVLRDGKVLYHESHMGINYPALKSKLV
ncbi:MAG: bacillithiol system redox-active protein YtxJ [Nitritalea sp.]